MVHKSGHSYFKDAIESIMDLNFSGFQFLLVNDGILASDMRLFYQLMSQRSDIEFEVIDNNEEGLVKGCRAALHRAKGDWIIRLDSDDKLEKNALNDLLNFAKGMNYDLVFPDYHEIDEDGSSIRIVTNQVDLSSLVDAEFHGACCLARTEQLIKIDAYSTQADRQDGFDLLVKMVMHKKRIGHLAKPLFSYRRHSNNISSNELSLSRARNQILIETASKLDWNNHKSAVMIPFRNNKAEEFTLNGNDKGVSLLEKLMVDISSSKLFSRRAIAVQENSWLLHSIASRHGFEVIVVPSFSTIARVIEFINTQHFQKINSLLAATVNFPFRIETCYDAAIAKLRIFNYDKMFSTTKVEGNVYRLGVHGMEYFGSREELRVRRDRLYIESGGLTAVHFSYSHQDIYTKRVGSFLVSPNEAIEVRDATSVRHLNLT